MVQDDSSFQPKDKGKHQKVDTFIPLLVQPGFRSLSQGLPNLKPESEVFFLYGHEHLKIEDSVSMRGKGNMEVERWLIISVTVTQLLSV